MPLILLLKGLDLKTEARVVFHEFDDLLFEPLHLCLCWSRQVVLECAFGVYRPLFRGFGVPERLRFIL